MKRYSTKRQFGNIGEDIACQFLERKGYRIIERNYLRKWGEIDIVAEREGSVRFIEVKTLKALKGDISREMSQMPEEMVHMKRLEKLARTVEIYMNERKDNRDYQIDVVGVVMDTRKRVAKCRLFEQVL